MHHYSLSPSSLRWSNIIRRFEPRSITRLLWPIQWPSRGKCSLFLQDSAVIMTHVRFLFGHDLSDCSSVRIILKSVFVKVL